LKSELVRRVDELSELKQYKQFLDQITPIVIILNYLFNNNSLISQEWKEERRKKLKQERLSQQKSDLQSTIPDDQASKSGSRPQSRLTDSRSVKRVMGVTTQKGTVNQRRTSNFSHEAESSIKQGSEIDTIDLDNDFEFYFTDPHQLLEIFTELEEQNLSLIQNSQDHEEQLEEITRELQITMEKKNAETEGLQRQVNYLEQSIASEEHKEKELMAKVG
jgi:RNA polymerase-interacting CarD/CdnL/TRCF family regulator